ncbi:hypothetical protein BH10ACT3_BH10ACT3_05490 [soil metagenome]
MPDSGNWHRANSDHAVMRRIAYALTAATIAFAGVALGASSTSAHTGADMIAVPAGSEATIKLKPNHGCGDSPTVEVFIQAPVPGATAVPVEGWTQSATPDTEDAGKTVLEWTGGSLPTDQTGEFPVTFQVPDTPGELLTFPAVQGCANGEELSWINGDPASDYPAPRLLILPAGSEPASTLDQVAPDVPGRDLLEAIVNVDAPQSGSTTTTTAAPTTSSDATPTTPQADVDPSAEAAAPDAASDDDSGFPWVLAGLQFVVVLAVVAVWFVWRRKKTQS